MPTHALRLVRALYSGNRCIIACGGSTFTGFPMEAGIRQGCPLSPLLFAVVVDLLLRQLARLFPGELVRAFADDTAMVVKDWWSVAPQLARVFQQFGTISGLVLNIPKTVIIPLWPGDLEAIRVKVAELVPSWQNVAVAWWATYLGIAKGPKKDDHSWDNALKKFGERIMLWDWSALGRQYAAAAYNTYAVSVLAFVSQLEDPPERAMQAENYALRRTARGPGNWAKPDDLWFFKENFGGLVSFASIQICAWAAQVRAFEWEACNSEGLKVKERLAALSSSEGTGEYMGRRQIWADWYKRSHVRVLNHAVTRLEHAGLTIREIFDDLVNGQPHHAWTQRRLATVKKGFPTATAHTPSGPPPPRRR